MSVDDAGVGDELIIDITADGDVPAEHPTKTLVFVSTFDTSSRVEVIPTNGQTVRGGSGCLGPLPQGRFGMVRLRRCRSGGGSSALLRHDRAGTVRGTPSHQRWRREVSPWERGVRRGGSPPRGALGRRVVRRHTAGRACALT